ncbi:MAG: SIS domain-containing protein [Pygmaiobacter massiliensis]|nr:SIS domain-containing protein [Pygmaiobacter massiliensis]
MIKGMQEVIDVMEKVKADFEKVEGGLKNVIFVACGGSLASSYPARYLLNAESTNLRVAGYNSNEFVYATPKCVGKNTLVICTSTKATAETVDAVVKARSLGAVTIGLTGYADSLTAQSAQYFITYYHADEWYQDPTLVHCNSQGTALKIAFWLLKEYDNYANYDKALEAFEKMPEIYGAAYKNLKPAAAKFAMTYKDDTIWNVMGSGAAWEAVYSDAFCFFQEMQTVHCVPIHSGEYFHGAFETTDKDLAILLLKSVGRTRYLDERAEKFLDQFAGHHYVIDAKELGLDTLDESVAEYFNAMLIHPITKQFIAAMGDVRMHPMSYRRYMWKFDY